MFTILGIIVGIVVTILTIKYFSGRGKSQSDKSATESIASTIGNKVGITLKDTASGMRDPEIIKAELLDKIKDTKVKVKRNYAEYLKGIYTSRDAHKHIITNGEESVEKYTAKAKDLKIKFAETNDDKTKQFLQRCAKQIIVTQAQIEKSKAFVADVDSKEEEAAFNFDLTMANLENKRAEIVSMACNPSDTFAFESVSIADLVVEFEGKMSERNINIEVSNAVNHTAIETPSVDSTKIDELISGL